MLKNERKEITIVLIIAGIAAILGLLSSMRQPELFVIPGSNQPLKSTDFIIKTGNNTLNVGASTWSEATAVFPNGKTLGMSTVYSAAPDEYLLSFTNKENILFKIDIYSSHISTYRNATTGMTFTQIKQIYGSKYTRIGKKNSSKDFDALYGTDNCIVFNIRNNKVWRIVVQREL